MYVNLSAHPIDRLGSPDGAAYLAECHDALERQGFAALSNFLTPLAVERMLSETSELERVMALQKAVLPLPEHGSTCMDR